MKLPQKESGDYSPEPLPDPDMADLVDDELMDDDLAEDQLPQGQLSGGSGAASVAAPASADRQYVVGIELAGKRLDQVLASLMPEHSRSRLQAWLREGHVAVDGRRQLEAKLKLHGGEQIVVEPPREMRDGAPQAEAMTLDIVHEDADILVINKPIGLVVHPGAGNWSGTLLNALLHHDPGLAAVPRAGIVHRLDKDTSGLMVVARTLEAQTELVRQLQARTVSRHYLALVLGEVTAAGVVDAPIGRHPSQRTRMAVVRGAAGKPARTHYRLRASFYRASLIECRLETGRTHQIRVHMASLKHPLVGDQTYGHRSGVALYDAYPQQALHAWQLGLVHPQTHEPMQWQAEPPACFVELLAAARTLGR